MTNSEIKKAKGFTLIEMLLSVALLGLLAGFFSPIYFSIQARNDLDVAANIIAQSLRRAQTLSRAMEGDSSWGVYVQSGKISIFSGVSFSGRDASFDEDFDISNGVTFSGVQEVVFDRNSGEPAMTGTMTLTGANNESRDLILNAKGIIDY